MDMNQILAAAATAEQEAANLSGQIGFEPIKFVERLQYMGIGMLVIFAVIGVIALVTVLINKIFSEK